MDRPGPDVPSELMADASPPAAVAEAIRDLDSRTACGGRVTFTWATGPKKDLPVTTYCVTPACIDTGACPAPRFVPHIDQYTHLDPDYPFRRPRRMEIPEIIAAVREAARLAEGAKPERRTDAEIADDVGEVWKRTMQHIKGGGWRIG